MRIYTETLNAINSFSRVTHSFAECFRRLHRSATIDNDPLKEYDLVVYGPHVSVKSRALCLFWETSRLKPEDVENLRAHKHKKILVTCKMTQDCLKADGLDSELIYLASEQTPSPLPPLSPFTFYTIYQDLGYAERKRAQDIVNAFTAAFPIEKDVRLILKQGPNCAPLAVFDSRVTVMSELLEDISALHKNNHVFVSACGAEGWGYPHLDAIAHGRPVICPAIGGPVEFLDETCAWLLPVEMIPAPAGFYDRRGLIGRVSVKELAYAMRYAYHNKPDVMEKGVNGFIRARQFTLDQMTVSVKKAFNL
jgi:glycosyltransferase involved in cell wall biosynthesis